MKTSTASGNSCLICSAPCQSISSTMSWPPRRLSSTARREVPYRWPCTWAHSRKSPRSTIARKPGSSMKWYSRPSCSWPRGARVVCDTDTHRCESSSSSALTRLDLPVPLGAATTKRLPGVCMGSAVRALAARGSLAAVDNGACSPPRTRSTDRRHRSWHWARPWSSSTRRATGTGASTCRASAATPPTSRLPRRARAPALAASARSATIKRPRAARAVGPRRCRSPRRARRRRRLHRDLLRQPRRGRA